jgi:hypothetical protein
VSISEESSKPVELFCKQTQEQFVSLELFTV